MENLKSNFNRIKHKIIKLEKHHIYYALIAFFVVIILISFISSIAVIQNHNNHKKLIESRAYRVRRLSTLNKIKNSRIRIESDLILSEDASLGLHKDNQKERNGKKYNANSQKELFSIYDSKEKNVYLTFDDGPTKMTTTILNILKEEKVPATFFVLGTNIVGREEILRRMYNEGHTVGNHSYTHIYKKIYKSTDSLMNEYYQTENALKKVLGSDFNSKLFRFPGGSFGGEYASSKSKAKLKLKEKGIAHIDWNTLTDDSAGADSEKAQLKAFNITRKNEKALIVLQHDTVVNKSLPNVLKQMIKTLKKEGYTFKNFNDILVKEKQKVN